MLVWRKEVWMMMHRRLVQSGRNWQVLSFAKHLDYVTSTLLTVLVIELENGLLCIVKLIAN